MSVTTVQKEYLERTEFVVDDDPKWEAEGITAYHATYSEAFYVSVRNRPGGIGWEWEIHLDAEDSGEALSYGGDDEVLSTVLEAVADALNYLAIITQCIRDRADADSSALDY